MLSTPVGNPFSSSAVLAGCWMASVSVSGAGPSAPAVVPQHRMVLRTRRPRTIMGSATEHGPTFSPVQESCGAVDPPAPNHHGVSHGARANIWSSRGVRAHQSRPLRSTCTESHDILRYHTFALILNTLTYCNDENDRTNVGLVCTYNNYVVQIIQNRAHCYTGI